MIFKHQGHSHMKLVIGVIGHYFQVQKDVIKIICIVYWLGLEIGREGSI